MRDLLQSQREPALGLGEVARECGGSRAHLLRQFNAVFGVTPHQYRMRARLERSKNLLVSGELSVTETCLEVGFSSLGSFSSLFRARFGESPSAYARRVRCVVAVPALAPHPTQAGCLSLLAYLPEAAFRTFREA